MSSRLRDPNDRLTCQCCGRAVRAQQGRISHHGFQRPGWGEIVSSCIGARELPYEASREALGRLIGILESHLNGLRARRDRLEGELDAIPFSYDEYLNGARVTKTLHVRRETFPALWEQYRAEFIRYSATTFDAVKERALRSLDANIKQVELDLTEQRRRHDAWKLTHEYRDGHWRPL
jgi:hypothetical protein